MEETQANTGKIALTYGLILGSAGIVFGLMLFSMDMQYERGWAVQGVQMVLIIAAISLGVYQFKKANDGFLSISEALKVGTGIALIAAILGLLYFFILSNFLDPNYAQTTAEMTREQMLESNPKLTEEEISKGLEMQEKFAWIAYPVILIINVITGLVVGLIVGLILKKQKPAY